MINVEANLIGHILATHLAREIVAFFNLLAKSWRHELTLVLGMVVFQSGLKADVLKLDISIGKPRPIYS